ncbi:type II toxin-antitoxin system VapC family toxin [Butyricimonas hominis]|uniref:type II toxin-antitoxin system VapC family toxin n=1 Tax=Butyricimonas hominis TaxID=2763032 RepID=UPI00344DB788
MSEITVAELLYGAECSDKVEENIHLVQQFCSDIEIIPISIILPEYARQKAFLRRQGTLIDDLDLFIGTTATALEYIMVTENVKHLARIPNIRIENWIKP